MKYDLFGEIITAQAEWKDMQTEFVIVMNI